VKRLRRENRATLIAASPKPWASQLYFKGEETDPHPTMSNACIVFREADAWQEVLWQNEFSGMLHVRRCPPYEETAGHPCDRPWTDADEAATTEWMQTYGGIPTIDGWRIFTAVQRIANERKFHPVRDYLNALRFDECELAEVHFDDWLTYYCGVPDTPYTRAIGGCFLIGAAARIYRPGCKMDTCLILEGKQGLKKSTVFKTLASEPWFTDASEEVGSKDAALQRRGKWFWEHAELDNLTRGDVSRIKADMSRSVDRFRPPYGHNMVEEPRQSVHCGTVNDSQYLRDATGARRFWPAACGPEIDIKALAADRDKLFAIAVMRYRLKALWYLDDPEVVRLAEAEQDERYEEDVWHPLIVAWLETNNRQSVTIADVLADALNITDRGRWPRADQMRVAACLKRLGWVRKHVRVGSIWQWRYARPDVTDL
jgi:predicted P-loop ATPase